MAMKQAITVTRIASQGSRPSTLLLPYLLFNISLHFYLQLICDYLNSIVIYDTQGPQVYLSIAKSIGSMTFSFSLTLLAI